MRESLSSIFRVRQYECDALDHLNNANYLRYMQESALDTFEKMSQSRLTSRGNTLQPRNVFIEFIRPFTFGDLVRVQTMISALEHDEIRLSFEFLKDGAEESYAISHIAFDFIEISSGKKMHIPIDLQLDLRSEHQWVDPYPSAETLQKLDPPQGAFSLPWHIEWRDVGSDQKLYIASYLDYLLDFVLRAAADCGWTHKRSLEEGMVWVVRRQWLNVLNDAEFEDELIFSTWISEFKRSTVTRDYSVHRAQDDILIAQARTLWIALDVESGRPRRIPDVWKQEFASQIFIR